MTERLRELEPFFAFRAHVPPAELATWTPARAHRHLTFFRDHVAERGGGEGGRS